MLDFAMDAIAAKPNPTFRNELQECFISVSTSNPQQKQMPSTKLHLRGKICLNLQSIPSQYKLINTWHKS